MEGCRLISSKIDDDCGCPEEEWDTPAGYCFFHLQPDFSADVAFDNGDYEWEVEIHGKDEKDFKSNLVKYMKALPVLDD